MYSHLIGDPTEDAGRVIAQAGLLIAERPQLGQGLAPGQLRVEGDEADHIGAVEDVLHMITSICLVVIELRVISSQIDMAAAGIVIEEAKHSLVPSDNEKRDGLIGGCHLFRVCLGNIRIPVVKGIAPLIQKTGLVAQAVEMFICVHLPGHNEGGNLPDLL